MTLYDEMLMNQNTIQASIPDRKKPRFFLCPKCKQSAKKLSYQSRTRSNNPVDAAHCAGCNAIVIFDKKMKVIMA